MISLRALLFALSLTLVGCSQAPSPAPVPPDVAAARAVAADPAATPDQLALAMVQGNRLGANLESMANRGARLSVTYAMAVQALGPAQADAAIADQIKARIYLYQPQWDANLAAAYASQMTPEQMRSITLEGKKSRHFEDFLLVRTAVSTSMREQSTPILEDLLVKSLAAALMEPAPAAP